MNILAMDTSGGSLSVAILQEDVVRFECTQQNGLTHSDSLMPLVDQALQTAGLTPEAIDCFAAVTGPGSFTGVRIGVTTAKSLAHATEKAVVGINALHALAANMPCFDGVVCPMQDARAGQVYAAGYRDGRQIVEDQAVKLDALLAVLGPMGRCCFIGDGAVAHREAIQSALGEKAYFPPANLMFIHASRVALLARDGEPAPWHALAPYYLRAPQAERERLAREEAARG